YTNADEFKFFLKRPLLTTGIPKLTRKGDLAARLIYITMPIISATERKTEAALEASIAERHARILGALIDVVVGILAHPDGKLSEKPRMAEFAEWIARARSTLGWSETLFAKSYKANRDDAVLGVLDDDVLGQAIVPLLDSSNGTWSGTASELLDALTTLKGAEQWKRDLPPRNRLSTVLERLRTALDTKGIEVKLGEREGRKGTRIITLTRRPS
ncbi:MAG: hypothetical protein ACREFA_12960, partial [Stellaceae bacterium]